MMNQNTFNTVLKAALVYGAKQDVRYYLNGVLFEFDYGNKLSVVATDGHRLGVFDLRVKHDLKGQWIVKREECEQLLKMFPAKKRSLQLDVTFDPSLHEFVVSNGKTTYKAEVEDGRYPEWRRVLPGKKEKVSGHGEIGVCATYLADACKGITPLLGDHKGVRVMLRGAASMEVSATKEEISGEYEELMGIRCIVMPMRLGGKSAKAA